MKNVERNKESNLKNIKKYQNRSIFDFDMKTSKEICYSTEDIIKVLPHRAPFLLIDSLNAIDIENMAIKGKRRIDSVDPIFKGHFPDYPVYPGVLQIEMIGQIAICLHYFLKEKRITIGKNATNISVRLVKLDSVLFLREILPDDRVSIIVKYIEMDDYLIKSIGQIIKNGKVCTVLISELYIV